MANQKFTYMYLLPDCRDKTICDYLDIGFRSSKRQVYAYQYHHVSSDEHQLQCYIRLSMKTTISDTVLVCQISDTAMLLMHKDGHLGNDMFLLTREINDEYAADVFQSLYYRQPGADLMLYE